MQRIAHAPNLAIATMWLDVLASDGIEATVQRQYLGGGIGELPPHHCLPEIWVSDDAQATRARGLLHDLQNLPQRHWACRACHEIVEGGFDSCWNCGAPMPPL